MSWLASFEVLPSPNHVLAKLAIFRGAEPSPLATDSASVFYYYFKPFALFFPLAVPCPSRSPVSIPPSLPYHLCTDTPVRSGPVTPPPSVSPLSPLHFRSLPLYSLSHFICPPTNDVSWPPGRDENFQTPRDRNRIVISRGSRPVRQPLQNRPNSLFLLCPWTRITHRKSLPVSFLTHFSSLSFFLHLPFCGGLRTVLPWVQLSGGTMLVGWRSDNRFIRIFSN